MQRALLAGALAVVSTAVIGTWVVLRGLSFMGDALAHGVLPGVALAVVLAFDQLLGALLGAALMIVGVNAVHRRTRLPEDVGIGLLFVGMLALGVIIFSKASTFAVSLTSTLFGDVLGVTPSDLAVQGLAALVTLAGALVFHRPFLALAFHDEKAEILGMRPRRAHLVMLGLVALAVVTSFRPVGALLVIALLVAPAATASLLVRRVPMMMVSAVAVGILSVVAGLLASYHFGTAGGASVAGVAVLVFFLVLGAQDVAARFRAERAARPARASR